MKYNQAEFNENKKLTLPTLSGKTNLPAYGTAIKG